MAAIGIYGGTFNPPHMGHIRAAEYGCKALKLEKLLVIPSCISPHKQLPEGSPGPELRLEMLEIAFAGQKKIEVSDLELSRGGRSFTFETVEQVRRLYPKDELVLFMGTDMFLSFHTWREPERILQNASLAVFYRGEAGERDAIAQAAERYREQGRTVYLVENPVTDISSTDLRRLLAFDCASAFLPAGVEHYIREKGLYGTGLDRRGMAARELERIVRELLKERRAEHTFRCRDTAAELAKKYGADPMLTERAALLHDITKALDDPLQEHLCQAYGEGPEYKNWEPATVHAFTGSLVAERVFGEAPEVVSAIRWHTTGRPRMTTLEKVVYLADMIEPGRDYPGVEAIRSKVYEDLDQGLELALRRTLQHLKEQGKKASPLSEEALKWLTNQEQTSGKKE